MPPYDVADELATYVEHYGDKPGWMDAQGLYPRSLRHFQLGLLHLGKERARYRLDEFSAVQAANAYKIEDKQRWLDDVKPAAGPGW